MVHTDGHNMNQQGSIKSAVLENINSVLSPDKRARELGEEKLKVLEVVEDFGLVLTEIITGSQEGGACKQLSAVLLRQYVDKHWSHNAEKFSPPETSTSVKEAIKSIIPKGLSEPDSKVRSTIAYVISSIAQWDWPDEWPQLFDILMQALASSDKDAVHGGMRVLAEFTRDIGDTQIVQIAPVIFPELYRIFITTGQYSNRTRSRAVVIFRTCANVIIELAHIDKGYIKQLLGPFLPKFIEAFLEALQSKNPAVTDVGIKTDIMKALTLLVTHVPSYIGPLFASIVSCVWACLVDTSDSYVKSQVSDDTDDLDDDVVDSEGEVLGPEALIYAVFEFISILIDNQKFHSVIQKNIQQLLYYVMVYTQITCEQETCWQQSPNEFVEDEDDDTFSYSVRISALELFETLIAEFEEEGLPALAENISTHIRQSEEAKASGSKSWWKIYESVLLAMGRIRLMFVGAIKEGKVKFNLHEFLEKVVFPFMLNSDTPLLTGRCLWMASRFSHALDASLNQRAIEAMVTGFAPSQPPCIRISSVRAAFHFSENLISSHQTELLSPALRVSLDNMLSIAQAYGTEVMALCIDSIESLLKVNSEFTASVTESTLPFFMAVFLKYSHDQHVVEICKDVITHLANARNDIVQQKMLPTLVSIIQQQQPDKLPSTLQPGSLEMIETLVRGGPEPISNELMSVFPMIAHLTIGTDDSSIMQNGGECLRAFVSKSAQQVVMWRDDQGNTGLSIIGSVVSKLLDPKAPEFSAAYVGRLVSLLITKLGHSIGSDLDLILRAVLSKLQLTETVTIVQELILVFGRLVLTKVDGLLDFLTLTPGPDGAPALNFVLTKWCSSQHVFYGHYETKVATVALSKLLLHAINTNDTRLQNIYLKEEITLPSESIRTRSKTKASGQQWTETPILIKIYKLLINELAHQLEDCQFQVGNGGSAADENGHYEDEDEDDEDNLFSNLIGNSDMFDDDDDENDPDVLNDPIYHMNMREYLTDFLKSLSQSQYYETFRATNTTLEQIVLKKVGIPIS